MDLGGQGPGTVAFRVQRGRYYRARGFLNRMVSINDLKCNMFRSIINLSGTSYIAFSQVTNKIEYFIRPYSNLSLLYLLLETIIL